VPAGIRMLPLMAVQTVALLMLWQAAAGLSSNPAMMAVLGTFGAITAGWAGVSLAAIAVVPRVRDQELLVTWRLALLLPGAVPLRSLALAVLLAAWTLVCTSVWPLGLLLGAGLAIDMAVGLLSRRIALLLEDLSARRTGPPSGPAGPDTPLRPRPLASHRPRRPHPRRTHPRRPWPETTRPPMKEHPCSRPSRPARSGSTSTIPAPSTSRPPTASGAWTRTSAASAPWAPPAPPSMPPPCARRAC